MSDLLIPCCPHCVTNEDGECNDIAARGYHRHTCGFEGCVGNGPLEAGPAS